MTDAPKSSRWRSIDPRLAYAGDAHTLIVLRATNHPWRISVGIGKVLRREGPYYNLSVNFPEEDQVYHEWDTNWLWIKAPDLPFEGGELAAEATTQRAGNWLGQQLPEPTDGSEQPPSVQIWGKDDHRRLTLTIDEIDQVVTLLLALKHTASML